MGPLDLLDHDSIYVDAQILIYTVENHPSYSLRLRSIWKLVEENGIVVYSSELSLLETLVLPKRNNDLALVADYHQFLYRGLAGLVPVSRAILEEAADLRARIPSLRTPDSIHASTAVLSNSGAFLSNDKSLRNVPSLNVVLLEELLP